ncbi:hypothetical protein A2U01_0067483 [Trifolium medium]|uniref:Uncharacterized protein n=1 Tax=Trifolium medium TaxID=97028 RepID=A0A392SBB2_9FABA|nr:hypothetical protein [Trifolium medium]
MGPMAQNEELTRRTPHPDSRSQQGSRRIDRVSLSSTLSVLVFVVKAKPIAAHGAGKCCFKI